MPASEVIRTGTDPSGRPILMSRRMAAWWERVCEALGFTPTIVQGAWMSKVPGGGADASAGYHDRGGCLDLRVWDLTDEQVRKVIRVTREYGAASWKRDLAHGGMDEHIHFVLGSDFALSSGAEIQWEDYIDGRDGLSTKGRDYHWRPEPLVLIPPAPTRSLKKKITAAIVDAKDRGLTAAADRLRKIRDGLRP